MKSLEKNMWSLRWVILLTVMAIMAGALLLVGFVVYDFIHLVDVAINKGLGLDARIELLLILIKIIVQSLVACLMLMFGFGIYEIFISKIKIDERSEDLHSNLLVINSIDELKRKLGSMVIMMLILQFLSLTTKMVIEEPSDLLMYATSVALLGLAVFLTNVKFKAAK